MDRLINSRFGLGLAVFLAHAIPPRQGYGLAAWIARLIASRRRSTLARSVRSNLWVATGEKLGPETLDASVAAVFHNAGRSIYDLYHTMQDPDAAGEFFALDPSVKVLMDRGEFAARGVVVAGLHMGSFDLGLQWFCRTWIKPLVLTLPEPRGGRRMEFEIRRRTGMNLVPATVNGMRAAIRHLKRGGIVLTGMDRPEPGYAPRPVFFGRPSNLPTHHIYLALRAQVPVIIVSLLLEPDGKYHIGASPAIEMEPRAGRMEELKYNAEKVLAVAENLVKRAPEQWAIFQPVWPEVIGQMPG
jgi:phosphatidylinositol dimannoside acyltransferase